MTDRSTTDTANSATWDSGGVPTIAALVSTFRRSAYLPELFVSLEHQLLPLSEYEIVVIDNGSADDTWERLSALVTESSARALAIRLPENHGPGAGRNAGSRRVRAPLLAITDDDCLPKPEWLSAMRGALSEDGVEVAQGQVHADPSTRDTMGPWDHTVWVTTPTPFFQTSNVGYGRAAYERVGGFDEIDPLLHPPTGRAFGEDACLAWEVQRTGGGAAFVEDSIVYHRCIPGSYKRWLADQRELVGFPGLARRSPLISGWLYRGIFLDRRAAMFDLAAVGVAVALLTRRRWTSVATLPWLRMRWKVAHRWTGSNRRAALPLIVRYGYGDMVGLAALLRGSARHRRLVL